MPGGAERLVLAGLGDAVVARARRLCLRGVAPCVDRRPRGGLAGARRRSRDHALEPGHVAGAAVSADRLGQAPAAARLSGPRSVPGPVGRGGGRRLHSIRRGLPVVGADGGLSQRAPGLFHPAPGARPAGGERSVGSAASTGRQHRPARAHGPRARDDVLARRRRPPPQSRGCLLRRALHTAVRMGEHARRLSVVVLPAAALFRAGAGADRQTRGVCARGFSAGSAPYQAWSRQPVDSSRPSPSALRPPCASSRGRPPGGGPSSTWG